MKNILQRITLFVTLICFTLVAQAKSPNITIINVNTQNADCYFSGKITVKLDGIDYSTLGENDQFTFYVVEAGTTNLKEHHFSSNQANSNLEFALEGYNPGKYELYYSIWINGVEYESYIGNATVGGNYSPLIVTQTLGNNTTMSGTRHTLGCNPTGRIQFAILQGKFPYTVQIFKDGQPFRTDVFNAPIHNGSDPSAADYRDYYDINNLPKGNYTFMMSDVCGYQVKLQDAVKIDELTCLPNFVSESVDTNNSKINFSFPDKFFDEVKYDKNIADWLEFRYKSENGMWTSWQDYTKNISENIANIGNIYGTKYSFEMRVKGCTTPFCTNDITITKPVTPPPPCKENKDVSVSLIPKQGTGGFFCPCEGGTSTPDYEDEYIINLGYTICQAALPLTYQVYDQTAGVMFATASTAASGGYLEKRMRTLEEGHTLHITLKDAVGMAYIDTLIVVPTPEKQQYTPPTPLVWAGGYELTGKGCDIPTGSVGIILNCRTVPAGTKVTLIQAPNNYSFTAEYTGTATNTWTITTNSSDFIINTEEYLCARRLNMVFDNLFHFGTYKWQVTDNSGRDTTVQYTVTDNLRKYRVAQNLSFTTKKNCHGMLYYPQAQVVSYIYSKPNDVKNETTKFRVTLGDPTGYEINGGKTTVGLCGRDSILITKPGIYTIEAFYNPNSTATEPDNDLRSCTTSTETIIYVQQPLEFKEYSGNLCADQKTGEVWGNIKATAKENTGLPPYSYSLYCGTKTNPCRLLASNTTGVFENIISGSAYFFVRVEDACHTSVDVDIPLTPIIISEIISGDRQVCTGSEAHLLGKTIGPSNYVSYQWKGADGFTSTKKSITTQPITEPTIYSLEIEGFGCKKVESVTVEPVDFIQTYYEDLICKGTNYSGDYSKTLLTGNLPAGIYNFDSGKLPAKGGCDSTAYLKLHIIEENDVITQNKVLCDNKFPIVWNDLILGEGTAWNDTTYTYYGNGKEKNRTYTYKIKKTKGCQYYEQLNMTVNPTYNDTIKEVRCEGNPVLFGGKLYDKTGIYTDYFNLATTCDSLSTLNLTINPVNKTEIKDSIYEGRTGYNKYGFHFPVQHQVGELQDSHLLQNRYGCDSLVVLNLSVLSTEVSIPEGFSPNGDGINDYFVIKNIELYPNNHVLILNRWGNKLYEGNPYMNQWDGRNYEGGNIGTDVLPVGTYFYILDLGDGSKAKKGYIYIAK